MLSPRDRLPIAYTPARTTFCNELVRPVNALVAAGVARVSITSIVSLRRSRAICMHPFFGADIAGALPAALRLQSFSRGAHGAPIS